MKTTKILYWILTGLMAAFMLLGAIPGVLRIPAAWVFPIIGLLLVFGSYLLRGKRLNQQANG